MGKTTLLVGDEPVHLDPAKAALKARNGELVALRDKTAELTSFIVHDLKSPIAVIATNLAFIRDEQPLDEPAAEALADAEAACHRLVEMVGDLLIISRIETTAFPLQREPVLFRGMAEGARQARARDAAAREIALAHQVPGDLVLDVDRALFQRVIENLLDNALRHTPSRGRIAIRARQTDGAIEVAISNTGAAIPTELRVGLFEKFARAEGNTRAGGNVGLGLYFCKLAVVAHSAEIVVESTDEWPTSFVVRFPSSGADGVSAR